MALLHFIFVEATVASAGPPGPSAAQSMRDEVRQSIQEAAQEAAQQAREAAQQAREAQQHVREAQQQVREAQQQLREAQQRVREAQTQLANASTADQRGAARQALTGAQEGVREAVAAVREAEAHVREMEGEARETPQVVYTTGQLPPFMQHGIPPQAVDLAIGFFITCAVMVIGWPIARAFGRRIERRGQPTSIDTGVAEQLQRIEHAVDAMAIEVERISESQRFMAKLQSGSAQPAPVLRDRH
jgi:multidrug efflux pump subunit AcrA (membrane-fusion protein)